MQTAARALVIPLFWTSAWMKVAAPEKAAAMIAGAGLPLATAGVWAAAAFEFVAPIMLLVARWQKGSAIVLAAYCVVTALLFHLDWDQPGQQIGFFKNLALAGLFLTLASGGTPSADRSLSSATQGYDA